MNGPFLTKVFYFNAAHQYGHQNWSDEKNWKVFGPDSKIHGHNYTLEVMVAKFHYKECLIKVQLLLLPNQ